MLFELSQRLSGLWGPLRLLGSHLFLIALGALAACGLVLFLLPRLWHWLPQDRGRSHTPSPERARGKPTGAGVLLFGLTLPAMLLTVPGGWPQYGIMICMGCSMLLGFLDDGSRIPWGRFVKGITDLLIALAAAYMVSGGRDVTIWLPLWSGSLTLPLWLYVPCGAGLLWLTMNATNCSDGVDGLAGTLTLLSLGFLGLLLYAVIGHREIADYLLLPHHPAAASWSIMIFCVTGGLAGYLWHNAEPSRILMGDAGSRFLGLLVGVAVLLTGNPFMVAVVAPVVLLNGGTGLLKILLLRGLSRLGLDISPATDDTERHVLVRALHSIRFPLHDHCRSRLGWSNAQVLMRFALIQVFLTPLLFVLLLKVR
jgi:phospho-N-acetylmuramoyl-pentapeptide-transferase